MDGGTSCSRADPVVEARNLERCMMVNGTDFAFPGVSERRISPESREFAPFAESKLAQNTKEREPWRHSTPPTTAFPFRRR